MGLIGAVGKGCARPAGDDEQGAPPMTDADQELRVTLRPSKQLAALLCGLHAGGAVCLQSLDLPSAVSAPLIGLLLLSAVCDLRTRAGLSSSRGVRELVLGADGGCRAVRASGETVRGTRCAGGLVHPLMVCFTLVASEAKTLPVLILPDMLDAESFRRVKVRLRASAPEMPAGGAPGRF